MNNFTKILFVTSEFYHINRFVLFWEPQIAKSWVDLFITNPSTDRLFQSQYKFFLSTFSVLMKRKCCFMKNSDVTKWFVAPGFWLWRILKEKVLQSRAPYKNWRRTLLKLWTSFLQTCCKLQLIVMNHDLRCVSRRKHLSYLVSKFCL